MQTDRRVNYQNRTWLRWILLSLIFSLFLYGCDKFAKNEVADKMSENEIKVFLAENYFEVPTEDRSPVDFSYFLLDGTYEQYEKNFGKIIFLNFWATWCLPCKKEMPDIEALHRLMKNEEFRILAINLGEKSKKVGKFVEKYSYTFDIIVDEEKKVINKLKILGIPTTFVLDKEGQILGKLMGPKKWNDPTFVDFLKKISRQ